VFEQMKSLGDGAVSGIELGSPCIGVDCIPYLVVAALIEATEIKPDLGDVRVDTDSPRVSVQGIAILINLEIQDANGTPERWVATVSVDSLLICLVRFVVFLACHVCTSQ
jgi:hypothetical protein